MHSQTQLIFLFSKQAKYNIFKVRGILENSIRSDQDLENVLRMQTSEGTEWRQGEVSKPWHLWDNKAGASAGDGGLTRRGPVSRDVSWEGQCGLGDNRVWGGEQDSIRDPRLQLSNSSLAAQGCL